MYTKRTKDQNLTTAQEQIIFALFMLYRAGGYIEAKDSMMCFSSRAIAVILGGAFSTYRRKLARHLVELGWVQERKYGNLFYYGLTAAAYRWCDDLLYQAISGAVIRTKPSSQLSFFDYECQASV